MDAREIFDKYEHIGVYIVDKETMITCYENPIAEKYTGRRRIGEPCYRVHGNGMMCSSCPIRRKNHVSFVNRSDLNMLFAVRCEETTWDNREAYLIQVTKQADSSALSEDEKSMSRMSRALEKSVNVYTEINMETMQYRQINLNDSDGFDVEAEGDYLSAYEFMCTEEIHDEDVAEVRRTMAPEVLQKIAADSEGQSEIVVRYRLKNVTPTKIMESRAIFMRDELPHYVVSVARNVTEEIMLREQADTLTNTLSNVNCGVAVYEVDEKGSIAIKYINEKLAELAECPNDALLENARKDTMYTIADAYRSQVRTAFRRIIQEGEKTSTVTYQTTTYQGNHRWIMLALSSQHLNGKLRIYGTFSDVTAETETKKEFQEKYEVERKRSRDDATMLAYGVFDLQKNTTIEMERRAPLIPIEKQHSLEALCENVCSSIVSADKKAAFAEMFNKQTLLKRHAIGMDEQVLEYQRRLPNGKVIWVRSTLRLIADPGKNTLYLFYYCNDIHMNKSLELMTTYMVNEDYDMLGSINLLDDSAFMLYGRNSIKRQEGQQGLYRQEKYSEALKWFVNYAVVKEERKLYQSETFVEQIRQKLKEADCYEFVLHVQDAEKQIRTKKIRYMRYQPESDICFFSQLDITDTLAEEKKKQERLQEALEAAKQANEAKTSFLSRMSHDMRTPMNGVLGLASLMRDETDLKEIAKDIDQLEMSGRYLLQLINDTLDVSKIESGKMELRLKPINSGAVFENILSNAAMLAREKGVQLVVHRPEITEDKWISVMADASRLEQVMMNIISNAVKFTPKGGCVDMTMETISVTEQEVVDRYIIKDTGIGMSEEFLAQIYEPFSQEGRIHTNRENGTGLGMSIVKQLVELMGGTISIQSRLNKGTEITLVMRYPVSLEEVPIEEKTLADLHVLKGKQILLCEDHPLNAQIAIRLLEKKEIRVIHAENGEVGVSLFAEAGTGDYDAILMDIRMPKLNGLKAAKAIRALDRPDAKTVPIIAMTANAFADDIQECMRAGMNDHLSKPVDAEKMYQTLAYYMK